MHNASDQPLCRFPSLTTWSLLADSTLTGELQEEAASIRNRWAYNGDKKKCGDHPTISTLLAVGSSTATHIILPTTPLTDSNMERTAGACPFKFILLDTTQADFGPALFGTRA